MKVIYWARLKLAAQAIEQALGAVPGCRLVVVEKVDELLAALPGAEGLVLYDAPRADAERVVAAVNAPDSRVRWMHFVSAGREGFEAA